MVKFTHKAVNGGAAAPVARLKQLSGQKVAVGIPSQSNERKTGDVGNADLLYIHTNGARPPAAIVEMQPEIDKGTKYSSALQMYLHEHGSMNYRIPPRPVLQPAIEKHQDEVAELLKNAAVKAMDGEDTAQALGKVGLAAQTICRDYFEEDNGWAPNAPSTIRKKKGSDNPLIDTGELRKSITYVVEAGK